MQKIITNSDKQTFALGQKIAKSLKGNAVIGLIGDLGAGKTVFTKGIAKGLGIKKNITSPTFVIMRPYPLKKNKAIKNFVHIDAYRLKSGQDLISIGATEYFDQPNTVTVIEWADKVKRILPKKTRYISFKILSNNKRQIILK